MKRFSVSLAAAVSAAVWATASQTFAVWTTPSGLYNGEQYRIVFITSGDSLQLTSTDISDYNNWVTTYATSPAALGFGLPQYSDGSVNNPTGNATPLSWACVGSTAAVNVIDNLTNVVGWSSSENGTLYYIYNADGQQVTGPSNGLFGSAHLTGLNYTEYGQELPTSKLTYTCATGCNGLGITTNNPLGASTGASRGYPASLNTTLWAYQSSWGNATQAGFYALSSLITYEAPSNTGLGVWNVDGGGNWSSALNWTTDGGVPGIGQSTSGSMDTATFAYSGTSTNSVITLDVSPQLAALTFGGGSQGVSYTLAGTGTLTLSGTGTVPVNVTGVHTIAANVSLASNAQVTTTSGSDQLTISGKISGGMPGVGLTFSGNGLTVLSGSNSYTGPTTVMSGTVQLSGPQVIAHLPFNGNTNDTSGQGNSGTAVNNPTYTAGQFGQALTLDGSSQYAVVPYIPTANANMNAFSVSTWFKVNVQPPPLPQGATGEELVSSLNGTSGTDGGGFDLQYINEDGTYTLHGDISAYAGWLTNSADYPLPGAAGTNGLTGWHMVTYTVNSSGYTIYLDGQTVASEGLYGTPVFMRPSGGTISFGAEQMPTNSSTYAQFFSGSLEDASIISGVLTPAQVSALYASEYSQLPTPGPILPVASAVSVASGAVLDLNGISQTVPSISDVAGSGGGTITNSAVTVPCTLTLSPIGGANTFSGTIDGSSSGAISLVMNGSGTQTLAGSMIGPGSVLVESGTLVLSGSNSYDGGTTVAGGILAVTQASAIPGGTSLTVGAGGTLIFDPTYSGAPVIGSAMAAVTAVPEPGTLGLLAAGLAAGLCMLPWRGKPFVRWDFGLGS